MEILIVSFTVLQAGGSELRVIGTSKRHCLKEECHPLSVDPKPTYQSQIQCWPLFLQIRRLREFSRVCVSIHTCVCMMPSVVVVPIGTEACMENRKLKSKALDLFHVKMDILGSWVVGHLLTPRVLCRAGHR